MTEQSPLMKSAAAAVERIKTWSTAKREWAARATGNGEKAKEAPDGHK